MRQIHERIQAIPGAQVAGYMPLRGDFDVEHDNDAERLIADMEFASTDTPAEHRLKLDVPRPLAQSGKQREPVHSEMAVFAADREDL
jgi:hypothetical protein